MSRISVLGNTIAAAGRSWYTAALLGLAVTIALPAGADAPAKPQLREQLQSRQRAAARAPIAANHEAGPQDNLSLRGQNAGLVGVFPRTGNEWCQSTAGRRFFGANPSRRIAVDMGRAHLHPDGGGFSIERSAWPRTSVASTRERRISS